MKMWTFVAMFARLAARGLRPFQLLLEVSDKCQIYRSTHPEWSDSASGHHNKVRKTINNFGYDKCVESEVTQISCWGKFRRSGCLVETVVFMALMLDVMLMTTIDPIVPAMLKEIEKKAAVSSMDEATTVGYPFDDVTSDANSHHGNKRVVHNGIYLSQLNIEKLYSARNYEFLQSIETSTEAPEQNSTHLGLSGKVGILVAAKPATEIIANLLVGCLVDRIGHHVPMLVGIVFNTAATVGFAYSHNFLLLMVTRVMQAIGSSLSVVSGLALLASFYPDDEKRSRANSRVFTGLTIGIVLGYPYGSTVYQFCGREAPFLILAGLTLFDGALRLMVKAERNQICYGAESGLSSLLCDGYIQIALGCVFIQHFGLGVFLATGPAWMLDSLHAQQWQIGTVLAVSVIFHLSAQVITGWLAIRYGRWKFCFMGMIFFSGGIALYPLCGHIWEAIGPEVTVRLGHGTVLCVISPLLSHLTDIRHNSQYGMVYGLYTAAYNLGLAVGPVAGGFLINHLSFSWIYWGTSGVIFLYSFMCFGLRNPRPRKSILMNGKDNKDGKDNRYCIMNASESLPSV